MRKVNTNVETIGFITSIILPTIRIMQNNAQLKEYCDIVSASLMASKYALLNLPNQIGFEYLEGLNRKIQIKRMKQMITRIIPKALKGTASKP